MRNALGNKYHIYERKSSKFGTVGVVDRGDELSLSRIIITNRNGDKVDLAYYNNWKRKDIYRTALDKYIHDQVARPIINLIVNATFSEAPDFQGDKETVKKAKKIVSDSNIDWSTWGADLEVHGDMFIRSFNGKNPKIASIPAQTIDVEYNEKNIIDISAYIQNLDKEGEKRISPLAMSHVKINNTSNTVYGNSTLRPVFWWLDVLDNLWERNWIRAAQYYGSPVLVFTGVPVEHIDAVQAKVQAEAQRPGKSLIFPEGVEVTVPDFTKNYPIELLIDRVYQYILSSCNIPQHLVYESDSSRGVAMFSGDAFEMMIKMRQKTWGLGLIQAVKNIMVKEGSWKEDAELKVKWAPVFSRDLKSLSGLIETGMTHKLYSRKSAREALRLDHSEEVENLKRQKTEEPEDVVDPLNPTGSPTGKPVVKPKALPTKVALKPKAKPSKRKPVKS